MCICLVACRSNWQFNRCDSFALIWKISPLFGRFCHRTNHVHPCNWVTKVLVFVVQRRFTFKSLIHIWLCVLEMRRKHVEIVLCGTLFFLLAIVNLNLASLRQFFKLIFPLRLSVLSIGLFYGFDGASRSDHTLRCPDIYCALRIFNLSIVGSHSVRDWNVRDGDLIQARRAQYWFSGLWWTSLRKLFRSFLSRYFLSEWINLILNRNIGHDEVPEAKEGFQRKILNSRAVQIKVGSLIDTLSRQRSCKDDFAQICEQSGLITKIVLLITKRSNLIESFNLILPLFWPQILKHFFPIRKSLLIFNLPERGTHTSEGLQNKTETSSCFHCGRRGCPIILAQFLNFL